MFVSDSVHQSSECIDYNMYTSDPVYATRWYFEAQLHLYWREGRKMGDQWGSENEVEIKEGYEGSSAEKEQAVKM